MLLASEALSLDIHVTGTKAEDTYSFTNGNVAYRLIWIPSRLGSTCHHLVPLVNNTEFHATLLQHHFERTRTHSRCAANDQCALAVGVNPTQEQMQCRHCLRRFHTSCLNAEVVGDTDLWFCGCAYEAKDLNQ